MSTTLVIGLGNAEKEYSATRHNLGMRVIESFAAAHRAPFKKHDSIAEIASIATENGKVLLMRSTGYMNESGLPLREVAQFYKITDAHIIVVYDDLDLPFGTIRVSQNTSSGGHNGVKSIIEHMDSTEFIRVRLGIGPKVGDAADYVLNRWSKEQEHALPEFIAEAIGAIETTLKNGITEAATIYN